MRVWEGPEGSWRVGRISKGPIASLRVLEGPEDTEGSERIWEGLVGSWRVWEDLGGSGRVWEGLGGSWRVWRIREGL